MRDPSACPQFALRRLVQYIALSVLVMVISYFALRGPHLLFGDAVEYIVQTQEIALSGSFAIDTDRSRNYWNRTNPFGITLTPASPPAGTLHEATQAGGGFGSLYPDRFHSYRYFHYFSYSLIVAPLYLLLHIVCSGQSFEYLSFQIANLALFFLPFAVCFVQDRRWNILGFAALFALSPLVGYLRWHSPEVMCFSFAVTGLLLAERGRWRWVGGIMLGVAASHYPPLIVVFPLYLWVVCGTGSVGIVRGALVATPGVIIFLLSLGYNLYYFGVPSLATALGHASIRYASFRGAIDIFVNPFTGALWGFLPLFLIFFARYGRAHRVRFFVSLLSVVAMAFLASTMKNSHSAFFGCERYAVWLLAPVWYVILSPRFQSSRSLVLRGLMVVMGIAGVVYFHSYRPVLAQDESWGMVRLRPETIRLAHLFRYYGSPHTFYELVHDGREIHEPESFRTLSVLNTGEVSSLWLVPKRAGRAAAQIQVPVVGAGCSSVSGPFDCHDGMITLDLSQIRSWDNDSWLGSYRYFWVHAALDAGSAPSGVFIR